MTPRIVLDAMGSEHGTAPAVEAAMQAVKHLGVEVVLVGRIEDIEAEIADGADTNGLRFVDAREVILMDENPTEAVRAKPDSSMSVGMQLLKDGEGDAFVTAGNTGGAMTAALLRLGRIRGISRPALATVFTAPGRGKTIILDVGANADCRPIHLIQFAHMGSAYMELIHHIEKPRVGLVSNGEEDSKGNALTLEVNATLRESLLNFTGNIEGSDVMTHAVDVAIVDGFTGNVLMKTAEGIGNMLYGEIEKAVRRRPWTMAAGYILKPQLKKARRELDHTQTGGAQLLGVAGNVTIGHGNSNAGATFSSIRAARDAVRSGLIDVMTQVAEQVPARPRKNRSGTSPDTETTEG